MLPSATALVVVLVFNLTIGLIIAFTNVSRRQNRFFLLFAATLTLWMGAVLGIIGAVTAEGAARLIRLASLAGVLIGVSYHLLCISIAAPEIPLRALLWRARFTLLSAMAITALIYSPWFLPSVTMPGPNHPDVNVPVANYGPGFAPFIAFFPLTFGFVIVAYVRRMSAMRGVQLEEIQFTLLGAALAVPVATLIHLSSLVLGSATQQYGPLCVVPMIAMIAYGIATRRIMGVADVLQRAVAYILLAIVMGIVFYGIWRVANGLFHYWNVTPAFWPSLIAAVVVGFTMTPAHGLMHRLARPLFAFSRGMNIPATLQQADRILQTISTLGELLGRIAHLIQQTTEAAHVRIYGRHDGRWTRSFTSDGSGPAVLDENDPLLDLLHSRHEPLALETMDRLRPSSLLRQAERTMRQRGTRLTLGLYLRDQLHGLVEIGPRASGRIYDRAEQETLQLICDQMAVALENARLYTEIQEGKIYLDNLLESLVSGVVAVNREGTVTVFNREAQRLTGHVSEDLVGRPMQQLPDPFNTLLNQTFEARRGLRNREASLSSTGGAPVTIQASTSLFAGHDGRLLGALLVFNDLTPIRQLQAQVRINDRLSSIGTLAAGMAHEIKNPLVSVKTFTQLLPERFDDADFRETFTSLVGDEVKRIDAIVNQLLRFSRPSKPVLVPTHLHDVITHTTALMKQQLRQKDIQLHQELRASSDMISADAHQLGQALVNFFLNAIEAMDGAGILTVSTTLNEGDYLPFPPDTLFPSRHIVLTIRDSGTGIAPEDITRIFDPFFTTKTQGTGLGLSVAHGIIHEHNGFIDVKSEPGAGTLFIIRFPLLSEESHSS